MDDDQGNRGDAYPLTLATASYDWYKAHAIRSRVQYRVLELLLLGVGAAIPASGALTPDDSTVPAILGAVVVVLSGLRALFHWQDNYVRFSQAREAVEYERRLYRIGAAQYHDPASRDEVLVRQISRIEQEEMRGWVTIAVERPKE